MLEKENLQLKNALVSHAVIDQAMGVILAAGHLSPAEAWDALREISMHTNIKVRLVAQSLVEWGATGQICTEISTELERQLCGRRITAGEPEGSL
ncbi:ANTAR domain-containing protein [Streptomyces sp. SID14478]|uniref:ANTAR domain-containing protein n=1 Tax=Streptomyces sp. SID14478 TaxID=2706073 RepID=UPI0031BA28DB